MSGDQLRRLTELEKENERLCRAVSDLTLDKQILKAEHMHTTGPSACANAGGNFFSIRGLQVDAPHVASPSDATCARLVLLFEVSVRLPHDGVRGGSTSLTRLHPFVVSDSMALTPPPKVSST